MTDEQKLEEIANVLEMEVDELNQEMVLDDTGTWDSVAVLSVIAIINEKFNKFPDSKDILECNTIGDLMAIMSE
jgi:Phosphopantetheine attachment site.